MKRVLTLFLTIALLALYSGASAQVDIFGKIKSKTDEKVNEGVDDVLNGDKKDNPDDQSNTENQTEQQTTTETDQSQTTQMTETKKDSTAVIKTYANYDFVAGENIIFDDDFSSDMDGEFPAHWDLTAGQAVVNKQAGKSAFLLTDGNYVHVNPLIKTKDYLGSEFTIEFDWYFLPSAYGAMVGFKNTDGEEGEIHFNAEGADASFPGKSLSGSLPDDKKYENMFNKWHHCAIAYKNHQLKVYIDATRVLVMPNTDFDPVSMDFRGIGSQENPIIITNVKIAEGGKMNMLDKMMTDGKIVTHGILFDVNKSTIKPESMGVINQIYQLLKDNPTVKFEIDGHTDSDGTDDANMKLSQARAEAVKSQLISMGIDGTRLTTKGFGESKPISDNATPEGKANNRRVEFVKM